MRNGSTAQVRSANIKLLLANTAWQMKLPVPACLSTFVKPDGVVEAYSFRNIAIVIICVILSYSSLLYV